MKTSLRARAAVSAAALLLTFGVAGCEGEDPADPIESAPEPIPPHSSVSAEASCPTEAGPVEPTLPAEAQAATAAGAEAFVRFYWSAVNYATKSGDVDLLKALAQPSCTTCAAGSDGIQNVYEHGGRITGGDYAVLQLKSIPSGGGDWAVVTHTRVGAQRTVAAGDLNGSFPAGRAKWLFGLARVNGSWSVATLENL